MGLSGLNFENIVVVKVIDYFPKREELVDIFICRQAEIFTENKDPDDAHREIVHDDQVA